MRLPSWPPPALARAWLPSLGAWWHAGGWVAQRLTPMPPPPIHARPCSIQNRYLWERFQHERCLLAARLGSSAAVNERQLWHGTSATPPLLIATSLDGIDFRMVRLPTRRTACLLVVSTRGDLLPSAPDSTCLVASCRPRQSSAGFYGRGAYFAETAAYSSQSYAHRVGGTGLPAPPTGSAGTAAGAHVQYKQLLLVRVLCGKAQECGRRVDAATKALVKPEAGCDSVHGGPHTSFGGPAETMMSVVYDRAQVYPELVVTYWEA